jgi:hypothetical protein
MSLSVSSVPAVTLDSTSLSKTVDQEEGPAVTPILISDEALLITKPNSRINRVGTHHPKNKTGKPFLVFCDSDEQLINHKATPVFLYHGIWHSIRLKNGQAILGIPLPSVHQYDKDETASEEALLRAIDLQIRHSPIQLPQAIQATASTSLTPIQFTQHPTMSTQTQTQTQGSSTTQAPSSNAPAALAATITNEPMTHMLS